MKNKIRLSVEFAGVFYDGWLQWCNRPNCNRCPHGPYWRRRVRLQAGNTLTKYIGRHLPPDVAAHYRAVTMLRERGYNVR